MRLIQSHLFLVCGLLMFIGASVAQAANWHWHLDKERYRKLSMFERDLYDKALEANREKAYRIAAAEFEKFHVQFPDSAITSYVLFARGYNLHMAKDRNKAIKLYNEVLDYFGESIADASAALFHLGVAHFDNGDIRKGMEAMGEMVEDEDYQKHPLAAGALRRLADNHWKNNEPEDAVKYWKQVIRDFGKTNSNEANIARANVTGYYIRNRDYASINSWLIPEDKRDDQAHAEWVARHLHDVAWRGFGGHWPKYNQFNRDEKKKDMEAYYAHFKSTKKHFESQNKHWDYYYRVLYFVAHRLYDRKEISAMVDECLAWVKTIENEKTQQDRISWVVDRLREGRHSEKGRFCISLLKDQNLAAYKEYELRGQEGKWGAAAEQLQTLIKMGDKNWQARAEEQLAWVYKDRLHKYDDAIKLYRQINKPPGTLWNIQECFRRSGKLDDALKTLTTIENMFPDNASAAAWHKARYYDESGNRKKAIAQARQILMMYKKSKESSNAHQLLEKYGIETGGGVGDEG